MGRVERKVAHWGVLICSRGRIRAGRRGAVGSDGFEIEPHRGIDRAGYPIEHDVLKQVILGKRCFDIVATIAPGPEFLDDPGGQTGRRIRQPIGQRLRLGALDRLVAALMQIVVALPFLLGNFRLGQAGQRIGHVGGAAQNEIEVQGDHPLGMKLGHRAGDRRTEVAALGEVAVIAQAFHQLAIDRCRLVEVEPAVAGGPRADRETRPPNRGSHE